MHIQRITMAACLGGMLASSGCDKIAEMVANKAANAAVDAHQAGLSDDDKLGNKLSGYIECINNASRAVNGARDRYLLWVDPKAGVTGAEKVVYGVFEINDQSRCIEGIKSAIEAEPDDAELEATASEYLAALQAATPVVNDAHKYYDQENHKDDKFAKGKEFHPKLMTAFAAFAEADQKLRALVGGKNEALQERELARVEREEGRKLAFHNKFVMAKAKKLVETADVKDLKDLDLTAYEAVVGDYEKAVDELEQYIKDHKAEVDSVMVFSMFSDQTNKLRKVAKDLMRRKRDKGGYSKDELDSLDRGHTHMVEGNPGEVLEVYNDLVSRSNGLNWQRYAPDAG